MSNENEVFRALETLIHRPGYAHVLAALCYNNSLAYGSRSHHNEKESNGLERLTSTELALLIGIFAKTDRNLTLPNTQEFNKMINITQKLLSSLHRQVYADVPKTRVYSQSSTRTQKQQRGYMREAMIYSGDSGYDFQFRDYSCKKYSNDDQWLVDNRGFSSCDACIVFDTIEEIQLQRVSKIYCRQDNSLSEVSSEILEVFLITEDQVAERSNLRLSKVRAVVEAFSLATKNDTFTNISEFNETNAMPLIPVSGNRYAIFDRYAFAKSLYESPYYWMMNDRQYRNTHTKNRGKFVEEFCAERLRNIFGNNRVHSNVIISEAKGKVAAEIDVLAHSGDRILLIESKSKRLQLDAQKGNLETIRRDFDKGIQHACNQGYKCAKLLLDDQMRETIMKRSGIGSLKNVREIVVLGVLSDHYPALSTQVRHYLNYTRDPRIDAPLVLDLFAFDVITQILDDPLYLFSYLKRRSQYDARVTAAQELTVFAYHLSKNLWCHSDRDAFRLPEGLSGDLDDVMARRRYYNEKGLFPEGILTRFKNTKVASILEGIKFRDDPDLFEIGLRLLELSEGAFGSFDLCCSEIMNRTRHDRKRHGFSASYSNGQFGITVHCSLRSDLVARLELIDECHRRKYRELSQCWYGLCLSLDEGQPRFGLSFKYPWKKRKEMDFRTKSLPRIHGDPCPFEHGIVRKKKIGRNEPCPCGSGRKYKKCCLFNSRNY